MKDPLRLSMNISKFLGKKKIICKMLTWEIFASGWTEWCVVAVLWVIITTQCDQDSMQTIKVSHGMESRTQTLGVRGGSRHPCRVKKHSSRNSRDVYCSSSMKYLFSLIMKLLGESCRNVSIIALSAVRHGWRGRERSWVDKRQKS